MEVRCGTCNKLFRVSDDKITGAGIKFPCTRCGAYVRITREDFMHYTRSPLAASGPDLFEQMPKPVSSTFSPATAQPAAGETSPPDFESQMFDLSHSTHEDAQEEGAPAFPEPEPGSETAVEMKPEPLMQSKPKAISPAETQPEPKPEPLFVAQQKARPAPEEETLPESAGPTPPVLFPPATPIQPAIPKEEYDHPAAPPDSPAMERTLNGPQPSATPSRSGKMFLVLVGTLVILGLAGYGLFVYLQPSSQPQRVQKAVNEMISVEGLQIVNPVGSVEANGDLLIAGAIENATERERTAWYVVVEIYDAQGAVISKIRILNGNQIYSQREYDILATRNVNVQELKEKILMGRGIVIPPKGMVNFEARYLQPPQGFASFVAQALPFDPVQLQKEIAGGIQ